MAAPPLLTLQNIHLTFGGTPLLEGAELFISPGERLSLVGRNGSGKSTLMKIAAGQIEPDSGDIFHQPGTTVRYLPQEPDFGGYQTALDYVEAGLTPGDDVYRAIYLLEQLGLTGKENPAHLSGGEARRAALARALAPEPDILLLDEPTNHLDLPAIEWLEKELGGMRSVLVLISHDRRFLENLTRATTWLDRGKTRHMNKGFAYFEAWRDEVLEAEEIETHKLGRKIAMEEDWLRYGVTARRKRNQKRLRDLHSLRAERAAKRSSNARSKAQIELSSTETSASGKRVVEAESLSKSFDGNAVIKDFSCKINRGDRIGIVGPNGSGKTTLLKMLMGQLEPDTGWVKLGTNLHMLTLDQKRESLNPSDTLSDVLTGDGSDMVTVGDQRKHVISYMKDFLFLPEQARTPVSRLSGGERGRLMLAHALAKPSNLLVLDEPTNDLDLETLDLLQEMLGDYNGTVLLVSHDRDFLDRVATTTLAFEGDGQWQTYAGGYSDMLHQRKFSQREQQAEDNGRSKLREKTDKPSSPKASRKLSFKDKHALETLPGRIDALKAKIAEHQNALEDPALFSAKPDIFKQTVTALSEAEAALEEAETRWLELEILREELEA
ncbi:MAG: ABC-F family ATP-binding cassette domain-containing protein [Hyphomicrobiales bacterium]